MPFDLYYEDHVTIYNTLEIILYEDQPFDKNISSKTHLSSDVNPIFEMNCSDNSAILVSVGTGCICLGRNLENQIEKAIRLSKKINTNIHI